MKSVWIGWSNNGISEVGKKCVLKIIVRLFNVCFNAKRIKMDWRMVCIASLYKGEATDRIEGMAEV